MLKNETILSMASLYITIDAMGMSIPHYEITPPVRKMVTLSECKSRYHNGSTRTLSPPLAGSILDTLKRDNDFILRITAR